MNTPQKPPLTEAEEARRGQVIAKALYLKKDRTHRDRYLTDWGTKTALGIFRMMKREVEEGDL